MFEKLQADYQRFQELEAALLDPAVTVGPRAADGAGQGAGALAKVAIPYGRYLDLGRQIAEAEALREAEADPEMRAYAEAELDALRERQQEVGEALRDLIYDQTGRRRPRRPDRRDPRRHRRRRGGAVRPRPREMYRRFAETDGLVVRAAGDGPDRARRVPRGHLRRSRARGRSATSSSRAAATASSASPRPRPRAASTPPPPPSPSCPSPRRSTSSSAPRTSRSTSCGRRARRPAPEQDRERRPDHPPARPGPSSICRDERSQHKNQAKAMRILREPALRPDRGEGPLRARPRPDGP